MNKVNQLFRKFIDKGIHCLVVRIALGAEYNCQKYDNEKAHGMKMQN